jgi:purine-binding chemotaxis protein CheW
MQGTNTIANQEQFGAPVSAATGDRELLAFRIGSEEYGVDIFKVQELRGYETVTQIANSPDYVKGVINLRGVIVPIVDLRLRLRIAQATYDQFTVVIILNLASRTIGAVVDSVSDVVRLPASQIKPPPELGVGNDTGYVEGLGTFDERMVILVDAERLIALDELPSAVAPVLQ